MIEKIYETRIMTTADWNATKLSLLNKDWEFIKEEDDTVYIRKSVLNNAPELNHKRQYDLIRGLHPETKYPEWEELSDMQREAIRQENRRYALSMQNFGEKLRRGEMPTWEDLINK